mgnify:CR=1 FL=1
MFEFNDLATLKALPAEQREGVRAFLLTHYNDPVNKVFRRLALHPARPTRRIPTMTSFQAMLPIP